MLISPEYAALNRQLHEERDDYGRQAHLWVDYIERIARDEKYDSILDYGCGKGEIKSRLPKLNITEYDPGIPGKNRRVKQAHDLVVCTDVLEHVEPELLDNVLKDLKRLTSRKLFFAITVIKSSKVLADGRNAHLIVKPPEWWIQKLSEQFVVLRSNCHLGVLFGEAFPNTLSVGAVKLSRPVVGSNRQRRPVTPEWQQVFRDIRDASAKYDDAFSRIVSVNVFEDLPCDQAADMQAVINVLNNIDDAHAMMQKVMKMARKAVLVAHQLRGGRDERYWKAFCEQYLRIAIWECRDDGIFCIGSPMVGVEGVTAVGVMDSEERWKQVKWSAERIKKRIPVAEKHERRAIVACYGPSLKDTIGELKREISEGNCDVISVSGAHDFLIEHGIVPTYHIECDPRPHKADNINCGIEGVQYLLASVVNEVLFRKLEGFDVALWHLATPEHTIRLGNELGETAQHSISGGGSVGLRSITVLYALGYRHYSIYGMDCSFTDPVLPPEIKAKCEELMASGNADKMVEANTITADYCAQWAGKHAGKKQPLVQVDVNGRIFTTSPILLTYATGFFETIQKVPDCTYRMVGNGLLQEMCALYWQLNHSEAERKTNGIHGR